MSLAGIDVSGIGQGDSFNWEAWRGKIAWAGVKITEGTGFADPDAARDVNGARSIGVGVVGYHFLHASVPGARQAQWWMGRAKAAGMRPGDAVAVDVEQGGLDNETPGLLWSVAADFAREIYAHYGCWTWAYTDLSLAAVAPRAVGACPLWLANPSHTQVTTVGPWKVITAEQLGQRGVDTDVFYGDLTQFAALAMPLHAPAPAPAPAPDPGAAEATAAIRQITQAAGVLTRYVAGGLA